MVYSLLWLAGSWGISVCTDTVNLQLYLFIIQGFMAAIIYHFSIAEFHPEFCSQIKVRPFCSGQLMTLQTFSSAIVVTLNGMFDFASEKFVQFGVAV